MYFMLQVRNYSPVPPINNSIKVSALLLYLYGEPVCMMLSFISTWLLRWPCHQGIKSSIGTWVITYGTFQRLFLPLTHWFSLVLSFMLHLSYTSVTITIVNALFIFLFILIYLADGSWNWRLPAYWIWVQQKQVSNTFV